MNRSSLSRMRRRSGRLASSGSDDAAVRESDDDRADRWAEVPSVMRSPFWT